MPISREEKLVRSFDQRMDEISLHVITLAGIAAREAREGGDICAVGSRTECALEAFDVLLDELLIAALSANVVVRRELLEGVEERRDTR